MTNRELLEMAAKAASVKGVYHHWEDSRENVSCGIAPKGACEADWWNPLHDDGDAFRLAVQLSLHVQIDFNQPDVNRVLVYGDWPFEVGAIEEYGDDHYAATRRAIVRAAAELGKLK